MSGRSADDAATDVTSRCRSGTGSRRSRAGTRRRDPRVRSSAPNRARGWARVVRAVRVAGAVASALVLLVTGYGWTAYRELGARLVTSDVLTRDRPADGVIDILLVGLDSRTDAAGNPLPRPLLDALAAGPDEGTLNTDTLILVRMPDDPTLPTTAVSVPRDAYVSIPRHGTHKINSAYRRGADAARARLAAEGAGGTALQRQVDQAGRRSLITTVEQLTGASVDHYAEVNLAGFAEVTQAVGGVPVCLNARVRDRRSGADFAAGPQTVEGPAALAFVRQRHGLPRGDLDRVVRAAGVPGEPRARGPVRGDAGRPGRAVRPDHRREPLRGRRPDLGPARVRGPGPRADRGGDQLPHDPHGAAEPAHAGGRGRGAGRPRRGPRLRRHSVRGCPAVPAPPGAATQTARRRPAARAATAATGWWRSTATTARMPPPGRWTAPGKRLLHRSPPRASAA